MVLMTIKDKLMQLQQQISDFFISATNNVKGKLSDYRGKWLVLYFYPKDSTPGCTTEGLDFKARIEEFKQLGAVIFGISCDSLASHEKFKAKQQFPFELISDEDKAICELFDVYQLKKMYGKEYMGIVRSTFLINPQGLLSAQWRKVKVKDHVEEVLTTLKNQ